MESLSLKISSGPALAAAVELLQQVGLPTSDLTEQHLAHFFFCGPADAPAGLVGLELHGGDALLRSLAVAPSAQRTGLGAALLAHGERQASARGVRSLYLLTTTAATFFEKHGYRAIAREACPQSIRASAEFSRLCPASATVLVKRL